MERIKDWQEIENSDAFRALSPAQQRAAKKKYPKNAFEMQQMTLSSDKMLSATAEMRDVLSELNKKIERANKLRDMPDLHDFVSKHMQSFAAMMEGLGDKIVELSRQEKEVDFSGLIAAIQSIPVPEAPKIPEIKIPKTSTKKMEDLLAQIKAELSLPAETEAPVKKLVVNRDEKGYMETIDIVR